MAMRVQLFLDKNEGNARVYFNEFAVYGFPFKDMVSALRKIEQVLRTLAAFPVRINGREDVMNYLISRRVYYREQPARVSEFDGERGIVILFADNEQKRFEPAPWSEDKGCYKVAEDLLSPLIHWNREE